MSVLKNVLEKLILPRPCFCWVWWASPAIVVCLLAGPAGAQSREDYDQLQCKRNLRLIYDAIRNYHRVNGRFPERLSVMVPEFVDSTVKRCLTCPAARRDGKSSVEAQPGDLPFANTIL